jgi:hypothetical protein
MAKALRTDFVTFPVHSTEKYGVENRGISRQADRHFCAVVDQKVRKKASAKSGLFFGTKKLGARRHIGSRKERRLQQERPTLEPSRIFEIDQEWLLKQEQQGKGEEKP